MNIVDDSFFDEVSKYEDRGLRDYQAHHKHNIYKSWKDTDSILLQMPTGTGKTRLFVSMINDFKRYHELHNKTINVLIVTHRKELVEQIKNELYHNYGIKSTLITADNKESHYRALPVCVASIQTLQRRLEQHWHNYPFNFLIIDEAHHTKAATYKKIVKAYSYAKLLGVTATPYRLNGEGFTEEYKKLIISPSVKSYIKAGWLSNYDYYSIKDDNDIYKGLEDIPLDKYGEYASTPLWNYLKKDSIRAEVVGSYLRYAKGKKGIVYTINKAHNKQLCEEFNECGITAYDIDSDTSQEERRNIVERFRKGDIDVICNVDIFTEGFDCPDVEVIQLARPTKSLGLYLQQVGRGLRIAPGKRKVLFLDNVGLHNRFGFPASKRMWRKHYLGIEVSESTRFISLDLLEPFDLKGKQNEIEEGCEEITLIESTGINELIEETKTEYLAEKEKRLKIIVDSIFDTNQRIYAEYVKNYSEDYMLFSSDLKEDLVEPCTSITGICDNEVLLSKALKNKFKPVVKNGAIVYESFNDIDDYIQEKTKMILDRFKSELSKAREQDYYELNKYTIEQLLVFFETNYGNDHIMTKKLLCLCNCHYNELKWLDAIKKWNSVEVSNLQYKNLNERLLDKEQKSKFKIGDRVSHPSYGLGTIERISYPLLVVKFDGFESIYISPNMLKLVVSKDSNENETHIGKTRLESNKNNHFMNDNLQDLNIENPPNTKCRFKVGDLVKHHIYGVGKVEHVYEHVLRVLFNENSSLLVHPQTLSKIEENKGEPHTKLHIAPEKNIIAVTKIGDKVKLPNIGTGTIIDIGNNNSMIIVKYGNHITKLFMPEDLIKVEDGLWEPKGDYTKESPIKGDKTFGRDIKFTGIITDYNISELIKGIKTVNTVNNKTTATETKKVNIGKKKAIVGDLIRLKHNGREASVIEEYTRSGLSWIQIRFNGSNNSQRILNNPKNYDLIDKTKI